MASYDDNGKRRLLLSIIKYLLEEKESVPLDMRESVDITIQCIEAAFNLEYKRDGWQISNSEDLLTIFLKNGAGARDTSSVYNAEAEEHKIKGNELMTLGKHEEAVIEYNKAIKLNSNNAIYYCNRAAAYTALGNNENAIEDSEMAVKLNPNYSKAYGRLGYAYTNVGLFKKAKEAFKRALSIDPINVNYQKELEKLEKGQTESRESTPRGPMNVPSVRTMTHRLLSNPNFRHLLSDLVYMDNPHDPNFSSMFSACQDIAVRLETRNPDFYTELGRMLFESDESANNQSQDEAEHPSNS